MESRRIRNGQITGYPMITSGPVHNAPSCARINNVAQGIRGDRFEPVHGTSGYWWQVCFGGGFVLKNIYQNSVKLSEEAKHWLNIYHCNMF